MKDKIAAKEQHIADLQKKAQVLWIFYGFCCHHLPCCYLRATAWPSLVQILMISHEMFFV